MAYAYRDVFAAADGLHKVKAWADQLQFDDDAPITLPSAAMFVRLWCGDGLKLAVCKLHDGGDVRLYYGYGSHIGLGPSVGNWPAAFDGDGNFCIRHTAEEFAIYNRAGSFIRVQPMPWASEGVHHVTHDGRIVLGNDPSLNPVLQGVQFWQATTVNGYTLGQSDGGDTMAGCIALQAPDGTTQMAQLGNIVNPPFLAVSGTKIWAVASGMDTPEPDAMPWERYRKYAPPVPTPDPPTPPVPPEPQPVPIDCQWTPWSDWSSWRNLQTFGRQRRERTRTIAVEAQHGGQPCDGSDRDTQDRTNPALPPWVRKALDWYYRGGVA